MTKRERVMAALKGEVVDTVPVGFWAHNYAKENSAADLADESLRLAREYDWDFLKPQCRAQCFAEGWGNKYRPSGERATRPTPVSHVVETLDDFGELAPIDPTQGSLGEQIEALRLIRAGVGPDRPIIWTVFNPLMICRYLARGDVDMMLDALRERPTALHHALGVIAQVMAEYGRAAIANGADGLFYATNVATEGLVNANEYAEFGRPYDLTILKAVSQAPFNLMHICGDAIHFEQFADYPVQAFNWAIGPRNPSLSKMERLTGRAVVGGVSIKPRDLEMSPEEVAAEVRAAISETAGRHLLVGPGCSSSPETPPANFHAARRAARESAPGSGL